MTIDKSELGVYYSVNSVLPQKKYAISLFYAAKYFYSLYVRKYSIECIKNNIIEIKDDKLRRWTEYFIEHAGDIKRIADYEFDCELVDIADALNISYTLLDLMFSPYKPFITNKDYLEFGVKNLENENFKYFYILLIAYLKDNIDVVDEDILEKQRNIVEIFLRYVEKGKKGIALNKIFDAFGQVNATGYLGANLSLSFNKVLYNGDVPLNGELFISWQNVRFFDGYYLIYHPKYPNAERGRLPFRVNDDLSRTVFNSLQYHFMRRLMPLYVKAENGMVARVINAQHLSECVALLERKILTANANNIKSIIKKTSLPKTDAREIVKQYKSPFLNYLCDKQHEEYNVICCMENRVDSNMNVALEPSFVFTIKEGGNTLKVAFENAEDSRCTYIFTVEKQHWQETVDLICRFFASNEVNKHEGMALKRINLHLPGGNDYIRIMHTDYDAWIQRIINL